MQPTHPHPWQPTPPPRKRAPWKTIGLITGAALVLCCGGVTAINAFTDPPATNQAADLAGGSQGQQPATTEATGLKDAPDSTPAATATAGPSPSRTAKPKTTSTKPKPSPTRTTKKPTPKPKPTSKAPAAVYYKNCTAVRAAGADPIRRGDPGYGRHLDRDGDGVGCE